MQPAISSREARSKYLHRARSAYPVGPVASSTPGIEEATSKDPLPISHRGYDRAISSSVSGELLKKQGYLICPPDWRYSSCISPLGLAERLHQYELSRVQSFDTSISLGQEDAGSLRELRYKELRTRDAAIIHPGSGTYYERGRDSPKTQGMVFEEQSGYSSSEPCSHPSDRPGATDWNTGDQRRRVLCDERGE